MPYGYNIAGVEEKKMSKHAKRRANKRAKKEAAEQEEEKVETLKLDQKGE